MTIDELKKDRDEWRQAAGVEAKLRREFMLERDELQQTFDLRWNADMRAIRRWQAAHPGNDLVWPDHADMVVWLMEELDKQRTGRASDEGHAAGRTKAGNDIGGL